MPLEQTADVAEEAVLALVDADQPSFTGGDEGDSARRLTARDGVRDLVRDVDHDK